MKTLNYELKNLCRRNRDGSQSTQHARHALLQMIANQLPQLGFSQMRASSLKPKHIEALVKKWQAEGLATGTLKQRMTALRWWAEKIGKPNVIARNNTHYGIGARPTVGLTSKAQELEREKLDGIADPHIRASLLLQEAFGLRREESIKFIPAYADQGDFIRLKPSWTKGGRARQIPVTTATQRALLDELKRTYGTRSLIPSHRRYVDQLWLYEKQTARAGLHKMHGLRHAYAQRRYQTLAGWPCPVCGGPTHDQLSAEQQYRDKTARHLLAQEMGHNRTQIVAIYVGS